MAAYCDALTVVLGGSGTLSPADAQELIDERLPKAVENAPDDALEAVTTVKEVLTEHREAFIFAVEYDQGDQTVAVSSAMEGKLNALADAMLEADDAFDKIDADQQRYCRNGKPR
jgi:hypothetical protein